LSSFYLYRFGKYVSHGFPIINFCNSGAHYEKPCTVINIMKRPVCIPSFRVLKIIKMLAKFHNRSTIMSAVSCYLLRMWATYKLEKKQGTFYSNIAQYSS
jgi:hypothetical protein